MNHTVELKKAKKRSAESWERLVSIAYQRMLGRSNGQIAADMGLQPATISVIAAGKDYPAAMAEAKARWLQAGDGKAMTAIDRAMEDPNTYAQTARWWAERRIPELQAKQPDVAIGVQLLATKELLDQLPEALKTLEDAQKVKK